VNVNSGKFTVTAASGNTAVAGTLGVTGLTTATGGINIGGGTTILKHYSSTFALNFGSITYGLCADSAAQTITGVALGDTVVVSSNQTWTAGMTLSGFASATNSVVVRWCNLNGAATDPDGTGATYRVDVWHH
jgi:hypothetical protein